MEYNNHIKAFFIDESFPTRFDFLIVAGFYFEFNIVYELEKSIIEILNRYGISSVEQIKNPKINEETRRPFNNEISAILKKHDVKIISSIIMNKDISLKLSDNNIFIFSAYFEGIRLLIERYYFELKSPDLGIIFYDEIENMKFIEKILLEKGSISIGKKIYSCSVPTFDHKYQDKIYCIKFLNNIDYISIQIADVIAGAIEIAVKNLFSTSKQIDKQLLISNIENLNEYFYGLNSYWDLFSRRKDGKVNGYGIKIW